MGEDIKDAWNMFIVHLLPKIAVKWSDHMRLIRSGDISYRNFSGITISDEAFVLHVLEWYLPQWESSSNSSQPSVKKKVGRKKSESTEDKKLENFVKFYNVIKAARNHGNKSNWEEAILEELVEGEEEKEDEVDVFGEKPYALPIEQIDIDNRYAD